MLIYGNCWMIDYHIREVLKIPFFVYLFTFLIKIQNIIFEI